MSTSSASRAPWPHPDLADDFEYALGIGKYATAPSVRDVTTPPGVDAAFDPNDIADVEKWYVEYHQEGPWTPEKGVGTELTLIALLRLRDGRYASLSAWNDYTGWGCQDGSEVRVGPREQVIQFGLDQRERGLLGLDDNQGSPT